jgi:hypothetical protein
MPKIEIGIFKLIFGGEYMLVLINGKVHDSNDNPIMILFSEDEIKNFKQQPDNVDIHCSFPKSWGQFKGQKWMNENKNLIIRSKGQQKQIISDDAIKNLLSESDFQTSYVNIFEDDGDKND